MLLNYYTNLIGSAENRRHTLDLDFLSIQQHNLEALKAQIFKEEVWNIIKQLPTDKAPGPDGFTGRFYKVCRQIIKGDIMAAVSAVWRRDFWNFPTHQFDT